MSVCVGVRKPLSVVSFPDIWFWAIRKLVKQESVGDGKLHTLTASVSSSCLSS